MTHDGRLATDEGGRDVGMLTLLPMTEDVFEVWFDASITRQAEDRAWASGRSVSIEHERLLQMIPRLLPHGMHTAKHTFWMAKQSSDDLVGGLWLGPAPGMPGDDRLLFDIFVEPEHRNQGFGRWMLETALTRLCDQGIPRVTLNVRGDNASALSLYRRLGFQPVGDSTGARWMTMTCPLTD